MILGYTLTTFPKSHKTLLHNQSNRSLWHNCKSSNKAENNENKPPLRIVSSRTLHNWWRIRVAGFLHSKETTEQNKEGGNSQPLKQQEKGQH